MAKNKSKLGKIIGKTGRFFYFSLTGGFRLVFIDSYRVIRDAYSFAVFPEKKLMLDRKLNLEKKTEAHDKRLKRAERLIYSMFNDPSYSKSNKGQDDINEIRKELE
jgi:hypothetical protein